MPPGGSKIGFPVAKRIREVCQRWMRVRRECLVAGWTRGGTRIRIGWGQPTEVGSTLLRQVSPCARRRLAAPAPARDPAAARLAVASASAVRPASTRRPPRARRLIRIHHRHAPCGDIDGQRIPVGAFHDYFDLPPYPRISSACVSLSCGRSSSSSTRTWYRPGAGAPAWAKASES